MPRKHLRDNAIIENGKRRRVFDRGFTVPGYNYCGPLNSLDNGPPTNSLDQKCQEHDFDYWDIEQDGTNPYFEFNLADEKFLEAIEGETGPTAELAKAYFKGKKYVSKHKSKKVNFHSFDNLPGKPKVKKMVRWDNKDKEREYLELMKGQSTNPNTGDQGGASDGDYEMTDNDVTPQKPARPGAPTPAPTEKAALASVGGARQLGGETPIDFHSFKQTSPWPESVNVLHKLYMFDKSKNLAAGAQSTIAWQFRLNSIYDCYVDGNMTNTESTSGAMDTADATIQIPMWRKYYETLYKYWTVIDSNYKFKFMVTPTAPGDASDEFIELYVYIYHQGAQNPPSTWVPHYMREQHPGMYWFSIKVRPKTSSESVMRIAQMEKDSCQGTWKEGSINQEIVEDEQKQTWHKTTEVPPDKQYVTIIIQNSPRSSNKAVTINPEITLNYLAQWKDLFWTYQYIQPGTNTVAVTDVANLKSA
jgi:hypothetical protein